MWKLLHDLHEIFRKRWYLEKKQNITFGGDAEHRLWPQIALAEIGALQVFF